MSRLFGTDGVRGKAGEHPLDHDTVARLGGALVRAMTAHRPGVGKPLRFVVGRDTRESGDWIARELARGVRSQGGEMTSAGVIATPAIAYITRALGFDAGIVISASHNPFEDNGIKVFSGRGEKFTEAVEREVEAIVADASWNVAGSADEPSRPQTSPTPTLRTRCSHFRVRDDSADSSWRSTPLTARRPPSRRGSFASSAMTWR